VNFVDDLSLLGILCNEIVSLGVSFTFDLNPIIKVQSLLFYLINALEILHPYLSIAKLISLVLEIIRLSFSNF